MSTENESAEPTAAPETAAEPEAPTHDPKAAATDEVDFHDEGALLQAAIAAAQQPEEGDEPEPEPQPEPEPKPEAEAAPAAEPEAAEAAVELDPKLEELAKQQAEIRAAREAQAQRDQALSQRESQLEQRLAALEKQLVDQQTAAQNPLAAIAKMTGENEYQVYQRLSHQVATGKPKEVDPQTALQQQFQSFQEDMLAWRKEQQTAQEKAEQEADEQSLRAGILDIINDGDYSLSKKVGTEQVRDHIFQVVKATFQRTGRAPSVRTLLKDFEDNARRDWIAIAANADDEFLKEAGLTRIKAESETQPRADGDRAEGPDTLTNDMSAGAPTIDDDDSYWEDDDEVLARAIAAAKSPAT